MDLYLSHGSLHVPTEIIDLIAKCLDTNWLLQFRLVCRATNSCATKQLVKSSQKVPSEMFVGGQLAVADDDRGDRSHSPKAVTLWTWLLLPTSDANEQVITDDIKRALASPANFCSSPTERAGAGRIGVCWGQTYENPALVAIAMQFHDEESLHRYHSSSFAARHRETIEQKWPGALKTSSSTRWLLPQPPKSHYQLEGWPLTEIRTVYFKADMTRARRELVNKSKNVSILGGVSGPDRAPDPGPTTWGWLEGLFNYKGQLAVAARYLIRWQSEERLRRCQNCGARREWQGKLYTWTEVFELELDAAGRIGQEVYRCDFEPEYVRYS